MKYPCSLAALSFLPLAFVSALSAEALVQYDFTLSASTVPTLSANVTAASFGKGAGISTLTSSSTGVPTKSIFVTGNLVDEPISATSTDWVGFTVTAASGYRLDLSSLSFYHAYTYTDAGASVPTTATFDVRSSVDGYATSIGIFTSSAISGTAPTWASPSVGLTASAYQGLSSITFRIFLDDAGSTLTTSYLRLDTVALTGNATAIPESSSYALLAGVGGLALVGMRRRHRSD